MEQITNVKDILAQRLNAAMDKEKIKNTQLAAACGVSPQAVGLWRKTGKIDTDHLPTVAAMVKRSIDHLLGVDNPLQIAEDSADYTTFIQTLPLIDPDQINDRQTATQNTARRIAIDPDNHEPHNSAFATTAPDNSMAPAIHAGDIAIIDPDRTANPGDIVAAIVRGRCFIQKYRPLSMIDADQFELIPDNPDYPATRIDNTDTGQLVGPVIEYRRKLTTT